MKLVASSALGSPLSAARGPESPRWKQLLALVRLMEEPIVIHLGRNLN